MTVPGEYQLAYPCGRTFCRTLGKACAGVAHARLLLPRADLKCDPCLPLLASIAAREPEGLAHVATVCRPRSCCRLLVGGRAALCRPAAVVGEGVASGVRLRQQFPIASSRTGMLGAHSAIPRSNPTVAYAASLIGRSQRHHESQRVNRCCNGPGTDPGR